MARDASVAKAGYFPLDDAGFDDLAAVLSADVEGHGNCMVSILDPCAGKGEVLRLARALGERYIVAWRELSPEHSARMYRKHPRNPGVTVRLAEMESTRAEAAAARFLVDDHEGQDAWRDSTEAAERTGGFPRPFDSLVATGDAFCLPTPALGERGWTSLLYLNPPYDADDHRRGARVEDRWLERFSSFVIAGGVLAFVVPLAAVGASARTLATRWTDVRIGRVREGSASAAFAATQVVVLARRVWPDLAAPDPAVLALVERAVAAGVDALPGVAALAPAVLPSVEYPHPPRTWEWKVQSMDYRAAAAEYRPWHRSARRAAPGARRPPPLVPLRECLPDRPWSELTAREFPTLMPLKPSYVADAIASGALDGELVEPADAASGLPALRVKGMFDRRFREVEVKYDSRGEPRASVQVQRPALRVSVLDPDGAVHVLGDSAIPSGSRRVAEFTVGDLVTAYGPSLAAALTRRCPTTADAGLVPVASLPVLRRPLFAAQAAAVRALAGRLLRLGVERTRARGATPAVLLQGQPGTGKTSMCLATARTVGARRVLVICPPHLVAEEAAWQSDAVAVLGTSPIDGRPDLGPGCDVRVLETPADVDRFEGDPDDGRMRLGIASREVAKLGHGYEGVQVCPRCGTRDARDPTKLASTRATCKAPAQVFGGPRRLARAAESLARALAWCDSSPEITERLPVGSFVARRRAAGCVGNDGPFVRVPARAAVSLVRAWYRSAASATARKPLTESQGRAAQTILEMADALDAALAGRGATGSTVSGLALRLLGTLRGACPGRVMGAQRRVKGEGWRPGAACGEPLWQAAARPRRWPLVRSLVTAAKRGAFDLLVLDEAHEYGNYDSAQAQAAERLVACGVPTILATGTVCNGYMSSMHAHFRALSTEYARDFARDDRPRAVARFGYQRRQVDLRANESDTGGAAGGGGGREAVELGAVSDRVVKGGVRVIGQAPGVLPEALLRYLAPATAQVHLEDLGAELPPLRESLVEVVTTDTQRAGIDYLAGELKARIRADRKDKDKVGKLFGQFADLPSFLDRCSLRPEWVVTYPAESVSARKRGERGPEVARLPCAGTRGAIGLPTAGETLPKEAALIAWCVEQLRRGRPCLVYVWHWDLMARVERLLRTGLAVADLGAGAGRWTPGDATGAGTASTPACAARVDVLDPGKVLPVKREAWIAKSAGARCAVLLTNPAAVKTGINSLARWWCSAAWYEGPGCSPEIRRQATHRLWRIGQQRPVEVASFVYGSTMQAKLHELLLHKVGVSEAVDGLDATAALTAAGVGEGDALASLEVGRALFEWCDGL